MISNGSTTGMQRPAGSEFRQRVVSCDEGSFVVSVVDVLGGQAVEAKKHHALAAVVATELHEHSMLSGVFAEVVKLLDDPGGWAVKKVKQCRVEGCTNGQPLREHWLVGEHECAPCLTRTVAACVECGMPDAAHYVHRERMLRLSLCFVCDLWRSRMTPPPEVVTPEWTVYGIGRGGGPKSTRGHGGHPFRVEFFDGTTRETDDLWCGGTVPEWFRNRFTPNATVESAVDRKR